MKSKAIYISLLVHSISTWLLLLLSLNMTVRPIASPFRILEVSCSISARDRLPWLRCVVFFSDFLKVNISVIPATGTWPFSAASFTKITSWTVIPHSVLWASGRAVYGVGLRPLAFWYCGFESHRGHGILFLVRVVCCQVEVSASGWSLAQRSPTDREVSEFDWEASIMKKRWPTTSCAPCKKIVWANENAFKLIVNYNFFC